MDPTTSEQSIVAENDVTATETGELQPPATDTGELRPPVIVECFEIVDPPIAPGPGPACENTSEVEKKLLKVVSVDLKVAENANAHHTDRYEHTQQRQAPPPAANPPTTESSSSPDSNPPAATPSTEANNTIIEPCLVVRRGEPFDIVIRFDRPFDSEKDDIQLNFDFDDNPRESRGTRAVLLLSDEDEPKKWGAKVVNQEGDTFTIRIFTPPHVAVSKWKFSFDTMFIVDGKREVFRHQQSYPVYILFNPWCDDRCQASCSALVMVYHQWPAIPVGEGCPNAASPTICEDDQVFLSDESLRNEYVLNDCGRVFYGTRSRIAPMPWNFGQFEDFVLDVSMSLLDMSKLPFSLRGNSTHVVRKISAVANAQDDNGVLEGNWSGDYSGGTSPVAWNGSVAILEEYLKTGKPVKYGQCWVFSAIVTTICRALGIPCRSVTNFVSAHDTDGSLTIDEYWDINGEISGENNYDSVWNFHVWNEVWMARPDLPSGFGGWQVIDATPQETSEGLYCAGPCSVEAIKQGLVQLPYDGTFIFAEVNADRVHFIPTREKAYQHIFEKNYIGKNVSTKGPDGDHRLDITDLYKFPEGSHEERTAVWRAVATSSTRKTLYRVEAEDIDFSLVDIDDVLIGEPFDVILKIRNKNKSQRRTVKASLTAVVVRYTGVPVATVKSYSKTVILKPNKEKEVKMTVTVADYVDKVTEMCLMKIASMSQVEETKQFHCDSDDFRLSKPTILIKVPAEMKLGEEYEIEASFTNPLPKTLTQCEFSFEAPSILRPIKLSHADVPPQGVVKCSTKLTPQKEVETEVIVGFWSKEFSDLYGTAKFKVMKKENVVGNDVPPN